MIVLMTNHFLVVSI